MIKYTPEQLDSIFKQIKEILGDATNKLRAIELRLFIDQLYPREEEINKQDIADVNKRFVGLNERIRKVEECLGIDFKLDKVESEQDAVDYIDYNFIQDNLLREKATAYYREMLRYKYATRNHKQCFGEFCRLAIIQVEFMLNYFFSDEKHFELIKKDLINLGINKFTYSFNQWKKYCKGKMPQKEDFINEILHNKEISVSQLNYSRKCEIFCSKYLTDIHYRNNSITSISIWTSNMRNRKSHGSQSSITPYEDYLTEEDKQNIEKWEKELLGKFEQYNNSNKEKISLDNKHIIAKKDVWYSIPDDVREICNKYSQLQWVSEKPFEDVQEFLRIVAFTCAKELKVK